MINTKTWQQLQTHFESIQDEKMSKMFEDDPQRFNKNSLKLGDILYDYSKNRINDETMKLLLQLANELDLSTWIKKLFNGDAINHTENRSVLHTALRTQSNDPITLDGINILPDIHYERERVKQLAEKIRTRQWRGATDQPITDVVNIGIGGSHLGPQMVYEALHPYSLHDLNIHFVSNVDENHINDTLVYLNPETTLFIIASKTFTTQDTMVNAETAKKWYLNKLGSDKFIHRHFCAVTSEITLAKKFGINEGNIFKMWDWVGGRYSLWSSISLSIVIAIGSDNFEQLLAGADTVDQHFKNTPLDKNIPVIMALLGIWYNNFFASETIAILPYDQHLHRFPAYLQQADMESNGKSVDRKGNRVNYSTGPILFGEIGISAQHAFFQLLHQGTKIVPCDILAPIYNLKQNATHHSTLMSNVFAQTEALMKGRGKQEVRNELKAQGLNSKKLEALLPYKIFSGNRPTSSIIFDTLDPKTLGSLIALYEHKIFVQGIIWNVNSFDQWGVELGKKLANNIQTQLNDDKEVTDHDSSTNGLINHYKKRRNN